jgi:hypothetical protein
MKPLTRVTLLALLFLFASTASFADTILIGQLYLDNTSSGPGGSDEFDLLNATGTGAPSNGTTTGLTFSGLSLSINGGSAQTIAGTFGAGSFAEILGGLALDSITSFTLTGNISPTEVLFNGVMEMISGTFTVSYSGEALNTAGSCQTSGSGCPEFDIDVTGTPVSTVPEPATLTLYGSGLCFVAWLRRRRSLKA